MDIGDKPISSTPYCNPGFEDAGGENHKPDGG